MSQSNSKRLTPGIASAVVLYIFAAVMAATVLGLTIAAGNDGVIVLADVHFGLTLFSLLSAGVLSTLASAAMDNLFSFPKDGAVDPAPYQLLPNINWKDSNLAMMLNYYIIAGVFAVIALGLLIAATVDTPVVLFSPVIHFLLCAGSLATAAGFMLGGNAVQDSNDDGTIARIVGLWIIAVALAVISAVLAICAANEALLFSPGFHFIMVFGTLAASACMFYGAGRAMDGDSENKTVTSIHLFITAGVMAVVAGITALVATDTVIFSAFFHIVLVGVLLIIAGVLALIAALIADHSN